MIYMTPTFTGFSKISPPFPSLKTVFPSLLKLYPVEVLCYFLIGVSVSLSLGNKVLMQLLVGKFYLLFNFFKSGAFEYRAFVINAEFPSGQTQKAVEQLPDIHTARDSEGI